MTSTLYVYIDESGNFDFNGKGTDHFVLSAFCTYEPAKVAALMLDMKYELMRNPCERLHFHATEDSNAVRDRVFGLIGGDLKLLGQAHSIWGDKHFASPKIHATEKFYALFTKAIATYLCKRFAGVAAEIVIVFDKATSPKIQKVVLSELKPRLKAIDIKYQIHFDQIKFDPIGQVADYVAWAHFRELERGDSQRWDQVRAGLYPSTFNIFQNGHTRYW